MDTRTLAILKVASSKKDEIWTRFYPLLDK